MQEVVEKIRFCRSSRENKFEGEQVSGLRINRVRGVCHPASFHDKVGRRQ